MPALERHRTTISRPQAAQGLVGAWVEVTGRPPSRELAELLLAQIFLETARGQSVYWHNWGNLTGSYQGNYWRPPWYEVTEESSARNRHLHEEMLAGRAPSKFAAFPNHEAGARTYADWLVRKFPSIVAAGESGDTMAFAEAVKASGYCPDCDPGRSEPTFRAFRDEFRRDGVFAHLQRGGASADSVMPLVVGVALFVAVGYGRGWFK